MRASDLVPRPVELSDGVPITPRPVTGCAVCAALMKQWRQATSPGSPAFDPSHATDLAVEIRRHPHQYKRRQRTR
ncbi:hypothetical protein QEN63_gp25 [Streptomyces phage Vondra]|uniref:Uncharacterized protein n=1 Tax=Streptomyces phage Vondra TaxID=2736273 RepID=A0A6M9Z3R0_9CAUD|nr:hypothetical protein QEN63_gp25 [Streptomyces phage Vondra]QKN87610.1 hypothetical protein SEA_VONDRA_25 [Streptomyces phage Vondra]